MSDLLDAFARTVTADRALRSDPWSGLLRAAFHARLRELVAVARRTGAIRHPAVWRATPEAAVEVYVQVGQKFGRVPGDPTLEEGPHG